MYEASVGEIERILKLVDACPEPLRAKAFEILLQGYVQTLIPASLQTKAKSAEDRAGTARTAPPDTQWAASIPAEVLPRLRGIAKRRNVAPDHLAALFDFSSDPFAFAPLNIEGSNNVDRTRKVALAVAARSFLATGKWVGDWAEIKAMCSHQNCYDLPNFAATLKKGKGDIFRTVDVGSSVELSAKGTGQAEVLLATLAGASDATDK